MEVVNGLSTVPACVDHKAVAVVEVLCTGDVAGFGEKSAQQAGILGQRVRMRGDVALGDHQQVHGSLRVDVRKGEDVCCFMKAPGRDGSRDDPAE